MQKQNLVSSDLRRHRLVCTSHLLLGCHYLAASAFTAHELTFLAICVLEVKIALQRLHVELLVLLQLLLDLVWLKLSHVLGCEVLR